MARTLHAAVIVEMPSDEWEAAALMTTLRPHWATFVEALQASGAKFSQELNTASTRNVARRRGRPRKALTPVSVLQPVPDPDIAA